MHARTRSHGFSILELSIVVVIIGLVVGMGFISMRGVSESAKRAQTEKKLDVIEKALMDFRRIHNRLPCPADITIADHAAGYGTELPNPGTCTGVNYTLLSDARSPGIPVIRVVEGMVPTKALNLPDEFLVDGWGRRFAYGVDRMTTFPDAFNMIAPGDQCWVPVDDDTSVLPIDNRSSAGMYALVSYGPNGHGARTSTGGATRINAGSSNADEGLNCHCDATGADATGFTNYVQKAATEGTGAAAVFDDIVRFKDPWQMQTPEDDLKFTYLGPEIAIGWHFLGNLLLSVFNYDCGTWTENMVWGPAPSAVAAPAGTRISSVQFTPDNDKLFVFSSNGCSLLNIVGDTITTDAVTTIPNCPASTVNAGVAMSDNGYLAIANTATNTIRTWRYTNPNGTANTGTFTQLTDITGVQANKITFSHNADYMLTSNGGNFSVYQRRPDGLGFTLAPSQPAVFPSVSAAISPDGKYIASITGGSNLMYVWRVGVGPTYTQVAGSPFAYVSTGGMDGREEVLFSGDSRYIFTDGNGSYFFTINYDDTVTYVPTLVQGVGYATRMYGTSSDGMFTVATPPAPSMMIFQRANPNFYTRTGFLHNSRTFPAFTLSYESVTNVTSPQVAFRRANPTTNP